MSAAQEERRQSGGQASTSDADNPAAINAASILSLASNTVLNERHSASRTGVPLGAIVTPLPDLHAPLPVVRRLPIACPNCSGCINPYCKVDPRSGNWNCLFCGEQCVYQALPESQTQTHFELKSEAVDYVSGLEDSQEAPPPIVALLIDAAVEEGEIASLKAAMLQVLSKIPRRTKLLLIAFSSAVSVFRLTQDSGPVAAQIFPGHTIATPEVLEVLTRDAKQGGCLCALHSCRTQAEAAVRSLRAVTFEGSARERPRCLGAAMHTAIHLISELADEEGVPAPDGIPKQQDIARSRGNISSGRLLVVTTGPTTKGPGRVPLEEIDEARGKKPDWKSKLGAKFFQELERFAQETGVAVDILAVGMAAVNAPLLTRVATGSGGVLLLHQYFGPLFAANAAAALGRRVGTHGVLDLHCTKGLQPVQYLGAVKMLDRGPGGLFARGGGSGFVHCADAVEVKSVERGQAVGICLEVSTQLKQPLAYIQVIVSWTAEDGSFVHRVVTRQLQVTVNRGAALRGVDPEISALLLAKRIIQEARSREAALSSKETERLRQAIGQHLFHVASTFGEVLACPGNWLRRKQRWILPAGLRFLSEALYQLQRGPMLGHSGSHSEEKALLQALFVKAAPLVALRMLAPTLQLLDRGSGQFNLMTPATIALWSDSAAILDNGSHIFIWLGKQVAAGMPDPSGNGNWTRTTVVCERQAVKLATGRFPVPELLVATEGSSNARYVASRLIPAHRDSTEEQEAQVPVLGVLTEEQLTAMLRQQLPTEEASLLQWCRSAGVEPPPPPDNVTDALEGMALARASSMGVAGLRRAQSLAERRRQPSLAASYGKTKSIATSMSGYVENQRHSPKGSDAV